MKDESSVLLLKQFAPDPNGSSGDETITGLVLAAARQTNDRLLGASPPDDVSPEVMLRLVTYCYTKGVYGSADIERKLRKSPVRQPVPDARALQRFRRHNREAVQRALERILELMHHWPAHHELPTAIRRAAVEKIEMAAIHDMSLGE